MEEALFLFLILGFLLIFIFGNEARQAKRRQKDFITSLYHLSEKLPEKEYPAERYERIRSFYDRHSIPGQVDDITWNDLSMDNIFKRINYTFSASGEEYLYYTLRNTQKTHEQLRHMEEVITFFSQNPQERVKIQCLMKELGHTGKFSLYDYIEHLDYLGERSNKKQHFLNAMFLPLIGMMFWNLSVGALALVLLVIYNIIAYFREKNEITPYIISFAYIKRLTTACKEMLKISIPPCSKEWDRIRQNLNELSSLDRGAFWVFSANQGVTGGNPLDMFMDYGRMIFHVDIIRFNSMLKHLRAHVREVDALIETVGSVETAIAIGVFRESVQEYCIPEFEGEQLLISHAYHPLLAQPVTNSIQTNGGVLITGSNASGKSTFLKTIAINAIMAQSIHTCCASAYKAPFFEIYSSMALNDNILQGESYYIVEIKALKRILDTVASARSKVLCFVDEVLRGTNTIERIAASSEILKHLMQSGRTVCFAATHDIELTELLRNTYVNYHFEEVIKEGDISFPYKLTEGPATTRNALKLLELIGYNEEVIQNASNRAEHFENTAIWV